MHSLRKRSGYLLMLVLLAAPFLYGGTTDGAMLLLSLALYGCGVLWFAGLALERRLPKAPGILAACAGFLFLQGWLMTLNARSIFDRDFLAVVERTPAIPWLPGSVDQRGSISFMMRLGALLLLLVMVADFSRSTRWVRRFTYTMAVTGVVFAALGVWQKIAAHPLRIWPVEPVPPSAFATFWYHGNAATFLNLTWPLNLTATIWAFQGQRGHFAKAFRTAGTALILGGLAMNGSKAGHLVAAGLIAVLLGILVLRSREVIARLGWKHLLAFATLVGCALTVLIVGTDTANSADRWLEYLRRTESDSRLATARLCLGMLPACGLFGTGPGTFIASFQSYAAASQIHLDAIWKYAHNDWLQYFVEWGWIGGVIWVVLWSLPLRRALENIRVIVLRGFIWERTRSRRSAERRHRSIEALRQYLTFGASLSLLGLAIHALFDFPLQIMSLQIYAFTLAGVLVAQSRGEGREDEDDGEEEDVE